MAASQGRRNYAQVGRGCRIPAMDLDKVWGRDISQPNIPMRNLCSMS